MFLQRECLWVITKKKIKLRYGFTAFAVAKVRCQLVFVGAGI